MFRRFLNRFQVLHWPLFEPNLTNVGDPTQKIRIPELEKSRYPIRLMRYQVAAGALAAEAAKLGRPLRVLDLGCEKGWLKIFTPPSAVDEWIGMDWNPRAEEMKAAGYENYAAANFDLSLPLESASVDAVVSLHVFEHLPRPGSTMAEVSRVLRPGGIFFGGAPTMPALFAKFRERWFRSRLEAGQIAEGGHINSLPPGRWQRLAYEVGMHTECVVGTHAVRLTGNPLESQEWWIRLNQFWGALFPSLGSDCYILARRGKEWASGPVPLTPGKTKLRPVLILLALILVCAAGVGIWKTLDSRRQSRATLAIELNKWVAGQPTFGGTFFVMELDPAGTALAEDPNFVKVAETKIQGRSFVLIQRQTKAN